ncbi:MAG: phospho-sugar mutase [Erysipelotrichales bacterium]|nr:phospho-sugar mutase [Erysipelotrichales bacterium]
MSYQKNYDKWRNYPYLEANLKNLLNALSPKEIEESFYRDLEFGTGGMRGILGPGTNRMNIYIVQKATLGLARHLNNKHAGGKLVISYDNRNFSKEFALEAAKVLVSQGFKVYLFKNMRPTPQLSFAVRHFGCCGGIMITASHNPKEYNGYKIYDDSGCQILPEEADMIIKEIKNIDDYFSIETSKNHHNIHYLEANFDKQYLDLVKTIQLNPDLPKDFKLVFTPLHGTGSTITVDLLKSLGYAVLPVLSQMTEDPNFSGTESANPEDRKAFTEAIKLAESHKALIALATDPDADRVGIAVLHNNEYILLNGNQTAVITMDYIAKYRKKLGTLPENGYVFTSNVSSVLPLEIAKNYGLKTKTTLTGFKYIGAEIRKLEAGTGEFVFGYEESFGSLQKDFVRDKDAIQSVLILAEIAAYLKTKDMTMLDYLKAIYQQYGYYQEDILNLSFSGLEGLAKMQEIIDFFRNKEIKLNGFNLIKKEDFLKQKTFENGKISNLDFPVADVIRYLFSDDSWFILRPSGTEPKLKIYFGVKDVSETSATKKLLALKAAVNHILEEGY